MRLKFSWLPLLFAAGHLHADQINLDKTNFEHIHFKRIQPNRISFENDVIRFEVNKSASFLLLAFDDVRNIRRVSFQWKANGMLNKSSVSHEKTRSGDDAWLRVGLIIMGEPIDLPDLLLPRWMKQVRKTLRYSTDSMVYLIPDARHAVGESWKSPFSSDIDMISVGSTGMADNWNQATHEFANPQQTVGLWIMADGDNTRAIFNSQIRNLVIK